MEERVQVDGLHMAILDVRHLIDLHMGLVVNQRMVLSLPITLLRLDRHHPALILRVGHFISQAVMEVHGAQIRVRRDLVVIRVNRIIALL